MTDSSTQKAPPSPDDIQEALIQVLASPQLVNTIRLRRFLRYVVEETLAGRSSTIKGYTIGVAVYDRQPDFDAEADTIVRVQAGQLRRRLSLHYANEGRHDPVRISLPKGRYVPEFHWREVSKPARAAELASAPHGPSIMVLPFESLSQDDDYRHVAHGIAEDIRIKLAQFKDLVVTMHHSSPQSASNAQHVRSAAEESGADFLLTGTFQVAGEQIRLNLKLVDSMTSSVLYAEQINRTIAKDTLFQMQDDVASKVAGALGSPFGLLASAHTQHNAGRDLSDLNAYGWVQRGYKLSLRPDTAEVTVCREALREIVETYPTYAPAWAALARTHLTTLRWALSEEAPETLIAQAQEASLKAIEADNSDAAGYHVLFSAQYHAGDLDAFASTAEQAMAINPHHPTLLAEYAILCGICGRWDDGQLFAQKALSLSVNPPFWFYVLRPWDAYRRGNYKEAADYLQYASKIETGAVWTPALTAAAHAALGDEAKARAATAEILKMEPAFPARFRRLFDIWHLDRHTSANFIRHLVAAGALPNDI